MSGPTDYAALLRETLDGKSSRRKLSYELAAATRNKQPSEYRALGKYLAAEEVPSRERAAMLAVLLEEPRLALVPDAASRRQDRLEALGAEVARLREERDAALQEVVARLAEIEGVLVNAGLLSARPKSARTRRR